MNVHRFLEIRIKGQPYALPAADILRIEIAPEMTSLPRGFGQFGTLIGVRGTVLPVMDLSLRIGFGRTIPTRETCIVVVQSRDQIVGFLVESVSQILRISEYDILRSPAQLDVVDPSLVVGQLRRPNTVVTILNTEACLTCPIENASTDTVMPRQATHPALERLEHDSLTLLS